MNYKVIDTNILLDFPQIITEEDNLMILTDVLRELDGLKMSQNSDTAFKARRAAVLISRNLEKITFNDDFEDKRIPVDDKLIQCAAGANETLITNDVYLKVKALIKNVKTEGYGIKDNYGGVETIYIETDNNRYSEWLDFVLTNNKFPDEREVYNNEFFLIKDTTQPIEDDYEILCILVNREGKIYSLDRKGIIKNKWVDKIVPRNPEQECLFEVLNNRNVGIVYAGGSFGTGKSFLLNNFAIQELEKGKIKKIVYVPNNSYTENTIELGALPGELLDKTVGQIGPLIDLVGIDQVQDWIKTEQLEVVPMSFIRGRSFQDSIVIVNEAQNLTEDHIKLLIARCGAGTRILFDGDLKQADSAIFRNKNGLKLLLQLRKSPIYSKIFAVVKLKTIERSLVARASDYLDNLSGNI